MNCLEINQEFFTSFPIFIKVLSQRYFSRENRTNEKNKLQLHYSSSDCIIGISPPPTPQKSIIIILTVIAVTGTACYLYRWFSLFLHCRNLGISPIRWLKSSQIKSQGPVLFVFQSTSERLPFLLSRNSPFTCLNWERHFVPSNQKS